MKEIEIDLDKICDEQRKQVQPPSDYRDYTKMCMWASIERVLEMSAETANNLFAEQASEDGRLITPALVKKEILSILERVK